MSSKFPSNLYVVVDRDTLQKYSSPVETRQKARMLKNSLEKAYEVNNLKIVQYGISKFVR